MKEEYSRNDQVPLSRAVMGLVGDLYAQTDLAPHLDNATPSFGRSLLFGLVREDVNPDLRADIISTLGEIILGASNFDYTEDIIQIVFEKHYLGIKSLASSCMDFFSSVLQTPMSDTIKHLLRDHSDEILNLVLNNQESEELRCSCIGLLGDLALNLPQMFGNITPHLMENIKKIVLIGKSSEDKKTRSISSWAGEQLVTVVKRSRSQEVSYSVSVSVTNKQFITQNIETENVTIRLNTRHQPQVIECSDVEATVSLPCPGFTQGATEDLSIAQLRRQRNKRAAVRWQDEEEEGGAGKRWRDDC